MKLLNLLLTEGDEKQSSYFASSCFILFILAKKLFQTFQYAVGQCGHGSDSPDEWKKINSAWIHEDEGDEKVNPASMDSLG